MAQIPVEKKSAPEEKKSGKSWLWILLGLLALALLLWWLLDDNSADRVEYTDDTAVTAPAQ
jgi:multidrug resistance efflux pump